MRKGGRKTGLAEKLNEELQCRVIFRIPIGDGIPVNESVVVTWIIMAVVTLLSIILTRNLKLENPGRRQLILESGIGWLRNFFTDLLGEEGKPYVIYLMSVTIYIGIANLIGILGFKPPTKDLNVTAGLAIMSIFLIEFSGFRQKGPKRFLKSFAEPMAIVLPINILEIFIKPVSLCMRLFGNVLGSFVIMELIDYILPVVLPIPFSFYFDIFDGLIQAYVFGFLTALFIKESLE